MFKAPALYGAVLACALGGAIAGNALGSTPVVDRSVITALYQFHETPAPATEDERRPPDHYPLVTRGGVVPVAQLSDRGLFSQARYRAPDWGYAGEVHYDPVPELKEVEMPAPQPEQEPVALAAVEPLQLEDGPARVTGQAKIIDVEAALALR